MVRYVNVKLIEDEDWDFRGVDTKYMTHGLHPYPARMIPQIARRLMEKYASKGDVVLDPFCGSGTVLVEARLLGLNSIGIDINPLACLLAEVKSNPLDPSVLKNYWRKLKSNIRRDIAALRFGQIEDVVVPDFSGTNIEYWFKANTIKELAIIRKHIERIKDEEIRKFFSVAFSITVREASGTRKREYKLYRMPKEEWEKYSPNTPKIFISNVEKAIEKMKEFYKASFKEVFSRVFMADTRKMFSEEFPDEANKLLLSNPPKIIVTSPPYGDSRTTVAYGQFSRLSSLWLSYENGFDKKIIMNVDKLSIGGEPNRLLKLDLSTLNLTIEAIEKNSKERAKETLDFISDLYKCLEN